VVLEIKNIHTRGRHKNYKSVFKTAQGKSIVISDFLISSTDVSLLYAYALRFKDAAA